VIKDRGSVFASDTDKKACTRDRLSKYAEQHSQSDVNLFFSSPFELTKARVNNKFNRSNKRQRPDHRRKCGLGYNVIWQRTNTTLIRLKKGQHPGHKSSA
jgi:hypothetical protein